MDKRNEEYPNHETFAVCDLVLVYHLLVSVLQGPSRKLETLGDGKQFPKPESEIRFCWGMSYNYIGQSHHNLKKYDVVFGLENSDFRTVTCYEPFCIDPQYCNKWNTEFNKVLYETCTKVWLAYLATITKLYHSKERIKHIMEKEIPAVVANIEPKPIESVPTIATAYSKAKRGKSFTANLISLGIQGFTAFNTNRKQNH